MSTPETEINIPLPERPDSGFIDPDQLRINQANPYNNFSGHMQEAEQNIVFLAAFAHKLGAVAARAGTKDTRPVRIPDESVPEGFRTVIGPDRSDSYDRSFNTGKELSTPEAGLLQAKSLGHASLQLAAALPRYGNFVYQHYQPVRDAEEAADNRRRYTPEFYQNFKRQKAALFPTATMPEPLRWSQGSGPPPADLTGVSTRNADRFLPPEKGVWFFGKPTERLAGFLTGNEPAFESRKDRRERWEKPPNEETQDTGEIDGPGTRLRRRLKRS